METTHKIDHTSYILHSKKNINNYIYNNDHKSAFILLVMVLEQLDDEAKNELIDYYSKKLYHLIRGGSQDHNQRLTFW